MAMVLYERGNLDLDIPLAAVVPEFVKSNVEPHRGEVSLRMLLAHSSGLPAYEKLFLRAHSPNDLLQAAFTTPLIADPGTRAEYSDIGFIILGVALARLADEAAVYKALGLPFIPPELREGADEIARARTPRC